MWLFTRFGFFSVVRKLGESRLTVRARSAADLDRLREMYIPALSETVEGTGTDYPYRGHASREEVAAAMARAVADIDYSNFKNEVRRTLGRPREKVMHAIWSAAREIETEEEVRQAFGGVVLNSRGEVLLCKPRNGFGGYVWTLPKGRPDPGEAPRDAAVREVREETGWECEIAGDVPGEFAGETTVTRYFLMRPVRKVGEPDHETEAIRWVSAGEARLLLGESGHERRARDLEVLRIAVDTLARL